MHGDEHHEADRNEREHERPHRDLNRRQAHEDGDCRSQGRTLRGAEQVRGNQGVLERSLERRARTRQAAADQEGQHNAGQANVEEDGRLLIGPRRLDEVGRHLVAQHGERLSRADGKAAQEQRHTGKHNHKHGHDSDDDVFPPVRPADTPAITVARHLHPPLVVFRSLTKTRQAGAQATRDYVCGVY